MPDGIDKSERMLVKRALDDPGAFQQLYDRYFNRVYRYVASRINHQPDAEDVVSEIFLRVIQNLPGLRNQYPVSFAAWLFVIARNVVTDHYRRSQPTEPIVPLDGAQITADPDVTLIEAQEAAQIRAFIAALPDRKRDIITLKYYGGLRNREIAVVLQIGEKTVSAYLSRALDDLYQQYVTLKAQPAQKVEGGRT